MSNEHMTEGTRGANNARTDANDTSATDRSSVSESSSGVSGTSSSGSSGDLNWGSARSDYGKQAYGGRLDESGLERAGTDYGREYSARGRTGGRGRTPRRYGFNAGEGASAGVLFLTGVGLGAALMYLLDPERGRTRRKLLGDKLTSLTNTAGERIASKSRDLRNRAQGALAETGLAGSDGDEQTRDENDRSRADRASVPASTAGGS